MTAIGISIGRARAVRAHKLQQALKDVGVRVMPTAWADEHKRALLLRNWKTWGFGMFAGYLFFALRWLAWTLSLAFVPIMIQREDRRAHWPMTAYVLAIFFLGAAAVVTSFIEHQMIWWPAIPVGLAVLSGITHYVRQDGGQAVFASTTAYWVSDRVVEEGQLSRAPLALRERAKQAAQIPGVRVYLERLDDDPLVYAATGWGPFREVCYLGGFATGLHKIDTF